MRAVDLFAGAGGFTAGAHAAGMTVVAAANHWRMAVEIHALNHPSTTHICQDLCQADFTQFPKHDVLLASPACQGHSKARGKDRPHHDACRSTAWAVIACAEVHRPAFIVVENVPEFLQWALYPAWCMALERLGYALSENIVDAANHGTPQHRERVFVVGTRSKAPLVLSLPVEAPTPARHILDYSKGKWSPVAGHAAETIKRVDAGRQQFGQRFLIAYYGNERGGRSLDKPLGTITTKDRFALIDGNRMRMLSVEEARRAMGFPTSYMLPKERTHAMKMLGNAVPPPLSERVCQFIRKSA